MEVENVFVATGPVTTSHMPVALGGTAERPVANLVDQVRVRVRRQEEPRS